MAPNALGDLSNLVTWMCKGDLSLLVQPCWGTGLLSGREISNPYPSSWDRRTHCLPTAVQGPVVELLGKVHPRHRMASAQLPPELLRTLLCALRQYSSQLARNPSPKSIPGLLKSLISLPSVLLTSDLKSPVTPALPLFQLFPRFVSYRHSYVTRAIP